MVFLELVGICYWLDNSNCFGGSYSYNEHENEDEDEGEDEDEEEEHFPCLDYCTGGGSDSN